jgi:hypothetical protein
MADPQQLTDETPEVQIDVDATADRLAEIASQSLDTNEVARQIEELTSVVLDSAEVSTRSASIAADVSTTMRAVVSKIQENNRRNVMHSRIMLGAFSACLLVAIGIFFAVTLKMTKSIKELDTMVYAMAKRVIEVDASLNAIGKTNSDFSEITDKQEVLNVTQTQVAKRLEEISKTMSAMPTVVVDQSNKANDMKFKDMQKQLAAFEKKLESVDSSVQSVNKAASARITPPAGPSTQVLLNEIQKLKADLNSSLQTRERNQSAAEAAAAKAIEKASMQAEKASAQAEKASMKATAAAEAARLSADKAKASEAASASERLAAIRAAAEKAAAMRAGTMKSDDQIAAEKALAAQKAAERKAAQAKADAERLAAQKAAAVKAAQAAAERARAAEAAAKAAPAKDPALQYPRFPESNVQ